MAKLKFITETGMFHSACSCDWGTGVEWYGFQPLKHRAPAGAGKVDRSDRSSFVKHFVTFEIGDALLRTAIAKVSSDYAMKTYIVMLRDCVSFTADVARQVNLVVPPVNMTPYGFLQILALRNAFQFKG